MAAHDKTRAQRLLDAHTAFLVAELTGPGLAELIDAELSSALQEAQALTLNDVVTRDMIKDTAKLYAVELELHGAMPELVGDIARAIYEHAIHEETRVGDLMSEASFREFLDKTLDMQALRERLITEAIHSPLYSALATDILYHGIKGYIGQSKVGMNIPGAQSMLKLGKAMASSTGLDKTLEEGIKKYIRGNIKGTLKESESFLKQRIDNERIEDEAQAIWHRLRGQEVALFRDYIESRDVEEFFVIAYEYWRELRKTTYYATLIDIGIDSFFDKYGNTSLPDLLAEVGIDQGILQREAMRFAPHVIQVLQARNLLEPRLRRQLQRFYESDAAQAVLNDLH